MDRNFTFTSDKFTQYIKMNEDAERLDLKDFADAAKVQAALDAIAEEDAKLSLVSFDYFEGGDYIPPNSGTLGLDAVTVQPVPNMPEFLCVTVARTTERHTINFYVFIPTVWNGRLMACCGGGSEAASHWNFPEWMVAVGMNDSLQNHFAGVSTDGGLAPGANTYNYPMDPETGEFDDELVRFYIYQASYWEGTIGKAVVEAVVGRAPEYSYIAGGSGGGNQAAIAALRYPDLYDGFWLHIPAVYYLKQVASMLWPAVVMNTFKNPLPDAKLDAFAEAVWAKYGGREAWSKVFHPTYHASHLIGKETADGPITELDAQTQQAIWDGPQGSDGKRLFWGIKPGIINWGPQSDLGHSDMCLGLSVPNEEGVLEPKGIPLSYELWRYWWIRDAGFDWRTLTMDKFVEVLEGYIASGAFDFMDCEPDFRALQASGHKAIMTIGNSDDLLSSESNYEFYMDAVEYCGGLEATKEFFRAVFMPHSLHGYLIGGPSVTVAEAMGPLMKWVEDGIAPESFILRKYSLFSGEFTAEVEQPVL